MFSKFSELSPVVWGILAALLIVSAVLYAVTRSRTRWTARMLANAALSIALSFILSYIRLYKMPQGGSITLASMLPLFLFAYSYGVAPGLLAGMAYGFLQFIQDAYFVHPVELLLDYPLAFALLGLCGFSARIHPTWGIVPGIVLGTLGRFLCSFLSGIIFFAMYAPEGQSVLIYSAVYNGLYLLPEAAICIAIALVPQVQTMARRMSLTS